MSFCHSFDQMARTPYRIYFVASSIGKNIIIEYDDLKEHNMDPKL